MLNLADRVLVVAPHPDDESLGAGGLLQAVTAAGAAARVVFATSGERNPWAQRATEYRLWLDRGARPRFADLRRRESLLALADLGITADAARYLELPDQGLTRFLLDRPAELTGILAAEVAGFRPTVLIAPSYWDLHPDHSALAVALDLAVQSVPPPARPRALWHYLVHHPKLRSSKLPGPTFALARDQQDRKYRAILSHRSQHTWRGPWLCSFAAPEERFIDPSIPLTGVPIRLLSRTPEGLSIGVRTRPRLRAFGRRILHLLAVGPGGAVRTVCLPLPMWTGAIQGVSLAPVAGTPISAHYGGGPRCGAVLLPSEWAAADSALYAKVSRRIGFFDEAGWVPLVRLPADDRLFP